MDGWLLPVTYNFRGANAKLPDDPSLMDGFLRMPDDTLLLPSKLGERTNIFLLEAGKANSTILSKQTQHNRGNKTQRISL